MQNLSKPSSGPATGSGSFSPNGLKVVLPQRLSRISWARIALEINNFEGNMAASHGTQRHYVEGCRCEECKEAHRAAARDYRERRASGQTRPAAVLQTRADLPPSEPGPVESGVQEEIAGSAEARPGLAATALALARIMDNPRAVGQQPAAARQLTSLLEKLRSASPARRGGLAVVRTMTRKG
jgi:hypothetical protein